MKQILVYDIEGIKVPYGYQMTMYSFTEMITNKLYDRSQMEGDVRAQTIDRPIGWIIQEITNQGKLIFVAVFEFEKWIYVEKKPIKLDLWRN